LPVHPARFVRDIPDFFVKFLTDEGDLVVDPFAGSNMVGLVSEELQRRWISIEINEKYVLGSAFRFPSLSEVRIPGETGSPVQNISHIGQFGPPAIAVFGV